MSDSLFLRGQTFPSRTAWLRDYPVGLLANDIMLGRTRWTDGADQFGAILNAVDCQAGAVYSNSFDGRLWQYRQDATGIADDGLRYVAGTPIRAIFHTDDYGPSDLPVDARVRGGDMCVFSRSGEDRYPAYFDPTRGWAGLSFLAQYKNAATVSSPSSPSDHGRFRSQYFDGSAHDVDWTMQAIFNGPSLSGSTLEITNSGANPGTFSIGQDGNIVAFAPPGPSGAFSVAPTMAPTVSSPVVDSPSLAASGAALVTGNARRRGVGIKSSVDSATAWSFLFQTELQIDNDNSTFTSVAWLNQSGWLGLGASPSQMLEMTETVVLTGDLPDGKAAGILMTPAYSGAFDVDPHVYLDLSNPGLLGGATMLFGAAVLSFNDNFADHAALGNVDIRGNTSPGFYRLQVDGAMYGIPIVALS